MRGEEKSLGGGKNKGLSPLGFEKGVLWRLKKISNTQEKGGIRKMTRRGANSSRIKKKAIFWGVIRNI